MFRKQAQSIGELLQMYLRQEGLETPLMQKRLLDAWDSVAGPAIARYTGEKFIKNQTLFVKILNPALRQDLSMMRTQILRRLNESVGSQVVAELRFY